MAGSHHVLASSTGENFEQGRGNRVHGYNEADAELCTFITAESFGGIF